MNWIGRRIFDGFILLLPLLLSYLLLGALFDLLMALTLPVTDFLPGGLFKEAWESRAAAFVTLIVVCFLLGIADRTSTFKRAAGWVEGRILGRFAPYGVLKSFASRLTATDVPEKLHPALLDVGNDARQLAFIVEEHDDGKFTLFVPIASTPGMGFVQIVSASKVEKLNVTVMDALGPLFNWGDGTKAMVAGSKRG